MKKVSGPDNNNTSETESKPLQNNPATSCGERHVESDNTKMTASRNDLTVAVTSVLIQQGPNGKFLEPEHEQVHQEMTSRGVPTSFFVSCSRALTLHPSKLVVGDHTTMAWAFERLGVPVDEVTRDSYPISLRSHLKRPVRQTTVKQLKRALCQPPGLSQPLFVKPCGGSPAKAFTGFVVSSWDDASKLSNVGGRTKVWCSPVVQWYSEYRVFCVHGQIVGVHKYADRNFDSDNDDADQSLDMDFVKEAVRALEGSEDATAAYGIDFGVMESTDNATGETTTTSALVEWNDGFALGCYSLDSAKYTNVLTARWQEVMALHNNQHQQNTCRAEYSRSAEEWHSFHYPS